MTMIHPKLHLPVAMTFSALAATMAAQAQEQQRPNVILLVADDLGYGDLGCYGAKNVETPNVDALARTGIRFTNCHAVAATSTPSRYSLLTGEYAWRRSDTNVAAGNAASIIRADQYTMADMFHDAGYATGAIGKWHLGLGSRTGAQDWNGVLDVTPRHLGFDYHYIQAATADRVPCVYLEQDTVANFDPSAPIQVSYSANFPGEPTGKNNPELLKLHPSHGHNQSIVDGISRIGFMKGGGKALWKDENIADSIVSHSVRFMREHKDEPFFLYLCTNDVHVPRWPHERFRGKNPMGLRGDAIVQFDWTVGQITAALDELGIADNTLIVLTSDNGPIHDDGYADRAVELLNGHSPTGGRRGMKYSGYEGGTIVPCIVSWPAKIAPADDNNTLMSHIDFLASFGSLVGAAMPRGAAPDSGDRMAQLLGESTEHRGWVSEQSSSGPLTVRTAKWKYIPASNNVQLITFGPPNVETGAKPYDQLFDMENDPNETTNVAAEYPYELARMKEIHREASSCPFTPPSFSAGDEDFWYNICTPNRSNLYMTVTAAGELAGVDAAQKIFARSQWKFVERPDGTCDIVNRESGHYIDPASGSNTQVLLMSADRPAAGWVIDYATSAGCVVFYTADHSAQLNQGDTSRDCRILNWGRGTQHTDAGCQFRFEDVIADPVVEVRLPSTAVAPMPSTAAAPKWYTICANKRSRHYLAGGAGKAESVKTVYFMPNLAWRIESRPDNTYNLINYVDNAYLSPETDALTGEIATSIDTPEAGWEIAAASAVNYYVITSGSVQASVSSEAEGYKAVGYPEAVSLTDAGCQFRFVDITAAVAAQSGLHETIWPERNGPADVYYDLLGRRVNNPRHGIFINGRGKRVVL